MAYATGLAPMMSADPRLSAGSAPRGIADAREEDPARTFSAILARADARPRTPEARARDAAEQFVALTLVQPTLKSLRDSNQAAPPFAPSEGEKQFRALLDAELAHRIVHKGRYGLVDRLARDLLSRSQAP